MGNLACCHFKIISSVRLIFGEKGSRGRSAEQELHDIALVVNLTFYSTWERKEKGKGIRQESRKGYGF